MLLKLEPRLRAPPTRAARACAAPPPGRLAPPPPTTFADDFRPLPALRIGETPRGGARIAHAGVRGQTSVLSKRLTNARTIDLALRSSYLDVDCPGEDDGETTCGNYCAEEHLSVLRAFTYRQRVFRTHCAPIARLTRACVGRCAG